ncbi:MAG: class I SAM-dependent methyltransferase [Pseudomonadales bacterium]|nr:class I SAM-dependent methyltransferase [Pseudomonadales bacterium]
MSDQNSADASRYFVNTRPEMCAFLPATYQTVLEVGCGEGTFSQVLKPDAEIWGIEPMATIRHPMHRTFASTFDDACDDLPDNYFDLIICNDVIEHMPDHDFFFSQARSKLTANGVLIGSIPNVRYYKNLGRLLFGKDWRYADSGILDRTHLRFFTEKSLKRTFAEHDFRIHQFRGINGPKKFRLSLALANVLTLFTQTDIRHMQFGFQIGRG